MPRKLPPHVESFTDRHGTRRFYFRRGKGKRTPLPLDPTSDAFMAAYADALAGTTPAKRELRRVMPGTLAALINSYLESPEWRELRKTTQQGYLNRLKHLQDTHGHRAVATMNRAGIIKHVLQPFADKPGQRLSMLKMLRVLIRHALDIEWLMHDPSKGIRRPKIQEVRAWTDSEIATFQAFWPIGTPQRLAFDLMLYTGQRRSDVHRMTWADIAGDTIRVVQQKTGAKLTIPLHRALAATLAKATRDHLVILATQHGALRTVDGFSGWMRDAITQAGLPLDAKPHGLRKAAGRMLAEAGCSTREIMAILGHASLAEAERYTRDADQQGLARNAIRKLEGPNANKPTQTTPAKFGEISKMKGKST